MAGLTYSIVDNTVEGNKRVITADITFDASYPTGGEVVSPADLGLQSILFMHVNSKAGNLIQFDAAAVKLMAYVSSTGLQVASTTDLSAVSVRVRAVGQ